MSTLTTLSNSRPIAKYHPCHWGEHFLNITPHDETTKNQKEQEIDQLKLKVREVLEAAKELEEQLKVIDTLERLGVAYHFEKEIDKALENGLESFNVECEKADLNHVSLFFRIFRQHGFSVSSDVFGKFKDGNGTFEESLKNDVEGMLSLFEASHVRVHDDKILDEALAFTTSHLSSIANTLTSSPLAQQVVHALHQPMHKGVSRVESRFYISIYEQDPSHNKLFLEFAKFDFNYVQSLHQKELQHLTRWWKKLHTNASFSRDRMTEIYFWVVGIYFEPKYAFARKLCGKVFKSTSLTDDTYDSYGTFEELKVLTEAFQRPWDKNVVDQLPEHVKWCYYAQVETCEEAEKELAEEGRAFCVDYLKQQVKNLSKEYIQEAEWCNKKYVPKYEEYMKNAIITSPYPLGTIACFLGMGDIVSKEYFEWASQNPPSKVIQAASTIIRLMDDMGGHEFEQSRNHVASAVQCLMEHNSISEAETYEILTQQVEDAWKDVNQAMLQPYIVPKILLTRILNLARSAHVIYHGTNDGYTHVNQVLKDKVESIFACPINV